MGSTFRTYYFDDAVLRLADVIDGAQRDLAEIEFDTLVGTGFSGGIVIPALALAMNKRFVLIRKETDDSHHGRGRMVGQLGAAWIFVDDFIGFGDTRRRVIQKVEEAVTETSHSTRMVGQYLYQSYDRPGFQSFDPAWVGGRR